MIFVEVRKDQIKLKEMQLMAICGATEANKNVLQKILTEYADMVLPQDKTVKKTKSFVEQAKEQLSSELKKAFIMKPSTDIDAESLSKNSNAAAIGSKYLREQELNKINRKSTIKAPEGIIKINK